MSENQDVARCRIIGAKNVNVFYHIIIATCKRVIAFLSSVLLIFSPTSSISETAFSADIHSKFPGTSTDAHHRYLVF